MKRPLRIATAAAASTALLALMSAARADVVETRELSETIPVSAGEPLVVTLQHEASTKLVVQPLDFAPDRARLDVELDRHQPSAVAGDQQRPDRCQRMGVIRRGQLSRSPASCSTARRPA